MARLSPQQQARGPRVAFPRSNGQVSDETGAVHSDHDMRRLLRKGDEVVRRKLREGGQDPDPWVPLHPDTMWYGYRRLWKTEINDLGWERTAASKYVGDWKPPKKSIADDVYASLSPGMLLAVVEQMSFPDAVKAEMDRRAQREASQRRPDVVEKLMGERG